jgi:hypothetical protein
MDYSQLITIEPGKRSGQPCIRGMRITVQDVLEYRAGGQIRDGSRLLHVRLSGTSPVRYSSRHDYAPVTRGLA